MIGIVDYRTGNVGSIQHKLRRMGVDCVVSNSPDILSKSDKLILPGVGHFGKAASELHENGLFDFLKYEIPTKGIPVLGICLGMQLMTDYSEEGNSLGLGWFRAKVIRFNVSDPCKHKVPHIGWNNTESVKKSFINQQIDKDDYFYFIHSYHVLCDDESDILFTSKYDYSFVSGIQKGNLIGVQFHPEKSHTAGNKILDSFVRY